MSLYKVTGTRPYRGYMPGDTFEANLDPKAEQRAIKRRQIMVVNTEKTKLKKGSYKLPKSKKEG